MRVADRVLRLGYFSSQPVSLVTALCDNGDRVDLLVVAPDTEPVAADAALILGATIGNLIPAQIILGHWNPLPGHDASDTGQPVPEQASQPPIQERGTGPDRWA